MSRFYARSASDKTDDWPLWFVADERKGGLNVTAPLIRQHLDPDHRGGIFLSDWEAVKLAGRANRAAESAQP